MSGPATMAPGGKCRIRFGGVISLAATLVTVFEPVSPAVERQDPCGVAPSCWQRGAVPLGQLHSTQPGRRVPVAARRLATAGPQRPGLSRHLVRTVDAVTTSANGRRLGRSIGRSGRSAGTPRLTSQAQTGHRARPTRTWGCSTVCGTLRRRAWRSRCWRPVPARRVGGRRAARRS
jgi:hypothetical protein